MKAKVDIKKNYPLAAYSYRVSVESTTLGFSEVSGLAVEHDPVIYRHGVSFALGPKIIPGMRQPIKLTLKRGVVTSGNGRFLADWFKETYSNPFLISKKDISIALCDELGQPMVQWMVHGALPVKLDAPRFDANSSEVAIETLELIAFTLDIDYLS